jgi:hypothetical protein
MPRNNKRNKQNANKRNKRNNSGQGNFSSLPNFVPNIQITKTYRFQSATSVSVTITSTDLIQLLSVCTSGAGKTAYPLSQSVRIKKIKIWGPAASTNFPVTVGVEYNTVTSLFGSPSKLIANTSIGFDRPAYVSYAPPKGSIASMWLNDQTADDIVSLYGPANTIVDVEIEHAFQDETFAPSSFTFAGSVTTGRIFLRPLDGAGASLIPLSYETG